MLAGGGVRELRSLQPPPATFAYRRSQEIFVTSRLGAGSLGGVRELRSLQPPPGTRERPRSSEIFVTSRLGAGSRRSYAAPPDSRCTSPEQKKIRRTGRIIFLWWRCRESNPGP